MTAKTAPWLLPIGFILHDGEELLTMVTWMEQHRPARTLVVAESDAESTDRNRPSTRKEVVVTMASELTLLFVVTVVAARDGRRRLPLYLYSALLGVFVAVIFGGYVPGVVTATTILPIVGIVTYRALLRRDLLSVNAAVITAIVGAAVFVPLFALFVRLARSIDAAL